MVNSGCLDVNVVAIVLAAKFQMVQVYLKVAISLLLSKIAVLILLVTSPGKGLSKLFGPRLICGAWAQFLLVLLTYKNRSDDLKVSLPNSNYC